MAIATALLPNTGAGGISTFVGRRDANIVKQQFDFSCGAASVATVLSGFYGLDIDEADVLTALDDEERYSFDDLSQVVLMWGFRGIGTTVTFDDLRRLKIPAIAYLRYRQRDHFSVIRGVSSTGIVHLGDPAFGNRRLRERRFKMYWEPHGQPGKLLLIVPKALARGGENQYFFGNEETITDLMLSITDQRFLRE